MTNQIEKMKTIHDMDAGDILQAASRYSSDCFQERGEWLWCAWQGNFKNERNSFRVGKIIRSGWNAMVSPANLNLAAVDLRNTGWGFCEKSEAKQLWRDRE